MYQAFIVIPADACCQEEWGQLVCTLSLFASKAPAGSSSVRDTKVADKKYTNRACPICVKPLRAGDDCHNCEHCRLSFHSFCWGDRGGCNSAGCPNVPGSAQNDKIAEPGPVEQSPSFAPQQGAQSTHENPTLRSDYPVDHPRKTPEWARPRWLQPVGLVVYAAALMVIATVFLSLWKVREKQAVQDFKDVAAKAEASEDPREAIRIFEEYIKSRPRNSISGEAERRRQQLREHLPEYDFSQVTKLADAAGESYESAERILRDYLATNPPEPFAERTEARLKTIPELIEARDYRLVEDQFSESSTDLPGRRAALEEFLARHPQGAHSDSAQKALALLADAEDEQALARLKRRVARLRSAKRYEEAVNLIDGEAGTLKSDKRKSDIEATRQEILSLREQEEAAEILALPVDSPDDRDRAISECRLFLLVNPGSAQAQKVKSFLEEISQQKRSEEWLDLRSALNADPDNLPRCIELTYLFQCRWPDWRSMELEAAVAENHLQVLKQAWADLKLIEKGTLIRKDGTEIEGQIQRVRSQFRVIDASSDRILSTVSSFQAQDIRLHPGPETFNSLTRTIQSLEPNGIDSAEVRSVLAALDKNGLERAALLIRRFLHSLNPQDEQSSAALMAAGCRFSRGQWLLPEEEPPSSRVQRIFAEHRQQIAAGARSVASRLDLKLTYGYEEIPVQCLVSYKGFEVKHISDSGQPLGASAQVIFTPSLRPGSGIDLEDEEHTKLSAMLRRLKEGLECVAELEIEEERPDWCGPAVEAGENGSWVLGVIPFGSAADRAWLEKGDEVLAVNGTMLKPSMSLQAVQDIFRGTGEDPVQLKLKRRGKSFSVQLERELQISRNLKARYRVRHNIGKGGITQTSPWVELPVVPDH